METQDKDERQTEERRVCVFVSLYVFECVCVCVWRSVCICVFSALYSQGVSLFGREIFCACVAVVLDLYTFGI